MPAVTALKETIGDLDVLAAVTRPKAVIDHFLGYEEVANTSVKGKTRATVMLQSGVQVDLRVVPKESFGSALHYFTGSKSHNIAIRKLGQARGLKINEYGVFREPSVSAAGASGMFFPPSVFPTSNRSFEKIAAKSKLPKPATYRS